jgi:outer membrane protein W
MMRRTAFLVVLINSLATATFAQHNQVSVFFSQSPSSVRGDRGYGAAFNHAWTPRFSTGVAVAVEDAVVAVCSGGIFTPQRCSEFSARTYPVDLTGCFHFINDTRWKPYLGLGLRYVGAPDLTPDALLLVGQPYSDHVNPELVGGLEFLIGPSFGITAEVKGLVSNSEDYDPVFKVSGGLNWRF